MIVQSPCGSPTFGFIFHPFLSISIHLHPSPIHFFLDSPFGIPSTSHPSVIHFPSISLYSSYQFKNRTSMTNMTLPERVENFLSRVDNEVSTENFVDYARKLKRLRPYQELLQETRLPKSSTTNSVRNKARLILLETYANLGKEVTCAFMLASTITELGQLKDSELPALMSEMRNRWNASTPRSQRLDALTASFFNEELVVSIESAIPFQTSGEPNYYYGIVAPLTSRRQQRRFQCPFCLDRAWVVFKCTSYRNSCR